MNGGRILVVDDEPQIRRALRTALSGHGYEVEVAENGEEALALIPSWQPDVLVLDLVMPDIDGTEVLRQTRSWSDLPVIVLSARGQERDKVHALDLGADDYLTKPFGMDELLARVRAIIRRRGETQASTIVFGDVEVDLARHVVTKADEEVHLTPTEFDLLRVLGVNAGKVITHRQLLERVWGAYAAENSLQLRVYISHLRQKLEDDPAKPRWIVTDLGVGYRLKTE
jgi:two-component system, OmpR family, KDP operon response regulator KdpE